LLLGQYPNDEDLAAIRKGMATAPMGKPRTVSEVPWPPR
jgi:penicillin-binding protein 2